MFRCSIVVLALALALTHATEEGSSLTDDGSAPKPECYLRDVPKFIDILKKHIKSVNNEAGEVDCSGKPGIYKEICKYHDDYAPGDMDIVIKWNDCGKITFVCTVFNVEDASYEPNLPEEVTNLGLNGDCAADTPWGLIGIGGGAVAVLAVIGGVIAAACKKKNRQPQNRSGEELEEQQELKPV